MYNGFTVTDSIRNSKQYDGSLSKFGITVDGIDYLVKYSSKSKTAQYSEYVASRFIGSIGIKSHKVWLGYYGDKTVNIIEDLSSNGYNLKPFSHTKQSSEDTDLTNKEYTYEDVLNLIIKHTKINDKDAAVDQFWDMYIMDAILGNRDRHRGNWGYLEHKSGEHIMSPIYDNGGCLFPDIYVKEDSLDKLSNDFIIERIEQFPASLFKMERADGSIKRTNYYEVIGNANKIGSLNKRLSKFKGRTNLEYIADTIYKVCYTAKDIIPHKYIAFYCMVVCSRYMHIICRYDSETACKLSREVLLNVNKNISC